MLLFVFNAKERERGRKRGRSLRKEKEGKGGRKEGKEGGREEGRWGCSPSLEAYTKWWQWVLLVWSWVTGDTDRSRLTLGS